MFTVEDIEVLGSPVGIDVLIKNFFAENWHPINSSAPHDKSLVGSESGGSNKSGKHGNSSHRWTGGTVAEILVSDLLILKKEFF